MRPLRTIPPWWANPIVLIPALTAAGILGALLCVAAAAGVLK